MVWHPTARGIESTPKSGHEREIPLAAPLLALLQEAGPKGRKELVSLTAQRKQWGEFGLRQGFVRASKKAGVAGSWTFHSLRHYFVTQCFGGGGSAPAIQKLAGHADLTTTERYAYVTRDDLRSTIARTWATAGQQPPGA